LRHEYSPSQMRADALVMLAQNFVGDKTLSTPVLSADIVIDINRITPGNTILNVISSVIEKSKKLFMD
jgi:hypothetical protein